MRKRKIRLVAALALLVILCILFLVLSYADEFNRIAYGMSKDEVHSILGPPTVQQVWWRKEQRFVDLWSAADDSLLLGYDSQGKVNFKDYYSNGPIQMNWRRLKRMLGI
jgi:hypothetical protein